MESEILQRQWVVRQRWGKEARVSKGQVDGMGKKIYAGPERRNLAKETENQRRFA